MPSILTTISQASGKFRPQDVHEFIALQLARKLHDEPHLNTYLAAVHRHPVPGLLHIYRTAIRQESSQTAAEHFKDGLEKLAKQ